MVVEDQSAADRRDNGFTQTLTQDQIDSLPDDPDEMAEELARMAGPGAQIFVNGFRGGRLPPKDQIQQIRFHTNSFSAEYHEAGMIRVEVITKPGMGGWRGHTNFGFRDESLNATQRLRRREGPRADAPLHGELPGPDRQGQDRPDACRSTATAPTTRAPSSRRRRRAARSTGLADGADATR